ncbi:TetR/AcrR family transcriptional regulator [Lipingzhangella sp. LS1_29]|uniref:TetR/AcrR family transcriptional regulator n=1 Tax=Lipingzhangella rawalii TaxID=2055835 RepID=A0ABU2H6V0_9ACTN|nr:TetR/AcrR family transcriptional regulator [Lipingzhangella rawalii]MDS1271028.1 TetR/AcrR family transcriptional regulator [Lipingzhangella rawalii]
MSQRSKRLPRAVREQQMIDAAIQVFSERGYHSAIVTEIAERAGVSKPMVYLYLGSKEDLFLACVRSCARELTAALQEYARPELTPEQRLWQGLTAFFTFVADYPERWNVLYQQAAKHGSTIAAGVAEARDQILLDVTRLVRDDPATGQQTPPDRTRMSDKEAEFVARALVGAADSLTDWMRSYPDEGPEQVTRRLMTMVWVGMGNAHAGQIWSPPG